jgi:hypothetical protein
VKRRVEAAWQLFRVIIPAGAPPFQRTEMKKAFYAGAFAMFSALVNGVDDNPDPSAADMSMMDEIHAELQAFKLAMKNDEDIGV